LLIFLFHSVQEPSAEGPLPESAALLPGGDADDQGGAGERAQPGAARHPFHQGPAGGGPAQRRHTSPQAGQQEGLCRAHAPRGPEE
jgi:hypothetical protein